jgi:hypothetical protein
MYQQMPGFRLAASQSSAAEWRRSSATMLARIPPDAPESRAQLACRVGEAKLQTGRSQTLDCTAHRVGIADMQNAIDIETRP